MKTRFSQQGLSFLGWMVILFIVSFFVTCAVKLAPIYMDAWTIKSVIENVIVEQKQNTTSITEIRKALDRQFIANRIEAIKVKDIKISRKKSNVLIDANYEKRIPLMYNVDVVVKFDKLNYEFQSSLSDG